MKKRMERNNGGSKRKREQMMKIGRQNVRRRFGPLIPHSFQVYTATAPHFVDTAFTSETASYGIIPTADTPSGRCLSSIASYLCYPKAPVDTAAVIPSRPRSRPSPALALTGQVRSAARAAYRVIRGGLLWVRKLGACLRGGQGEGRHSRGGEGGRVRERDAPAGYTRAPIAGPGAQGESGALRQRRSRHPRVAA